MLRIESRRNYLSFSQHAFRERQARATAGLIAVAIILVSSSCGSTGLDSYTKAVGAADEGLAIQTIRTIVTAQQQYRATHDEYGSFDALTKAGILDARFVGDAPNLKGYRFTMSVATDAFTINADPQASETQPAIGGRHFYLDSNDGVIRSNLKQPAGASDPPQ